MKNKIKQFSKGNFNLAKPDIFFPETHIKISVGEGEQYKGYFLIESRNEGAIRGLVYASSFRVQFSEQGFEGNPIRVNFTYDSTGLTPGHIENGKITVVCNGGEYDLTFTALVEKPFVVTNYGKIQNLADFKRLAMQDFSEAKLLFKSRQFYDVIKYEDVRVRNLYDNVRKWSLNEQALEEFLVGIKQKEKIFFVLSKDEIEYQNILEDQQDFIEILKNTWGHTIVSMWSDSEFLTIKHKEITAEDFVGNTYRLEYRLHKDKLHAGNNFGSIHIQTPYETLRVNIVVRQFVEHKENHNVKGILAGQGLKDYLACISGRMNVHVWSEKAIEFVRQMQALEPENEYYKLLQAHIYLKSGQEQEATWILENSNFTKFTIGRKSEVTAYYLFLMALLKKDSMSVNRALDEINRLYMKHPYSWPLLCMIINLDMKYRSYQDRIRVLERQFFNGSNQVLLYAEAYVCFQERVTLLRKLESFELQILNFATKYKIITKELALYAADLISQQKKYSQKLVRILERAYAMYPEPDILHALCTQLIKGNKIGPEYFRWYEKAVKADLKIAQLYEYYMMSVEESKVRSAFPRIIYLYFMHGIQLDYKKTALLYANILTYENEQSELFLAYKEQIRSFAWDQLRKKNVTDSLRVIYNRFLKEKELSLEELHALYDICHKYHVTTDKQGMKYVFVIDKDGRVSQRVAYTQQGAEIYLYDKESRIIWEGYDGYQYIDSISYDVVRLFYEMRFIELCKKELPEHKQSIGEAAKPSLNFDNIKLYGIDAFAEEDVFMLCSKRIREKENVEDDFLLTVSYELMKRGLYDKAILNYLSHFYCGATRDMKYLWKIARDYEVSTYSLAERIISQMVFAENMFHEEEIFEDYYAGKPYFRLKQGYLAYAAYLYVVKERYLSKNIFAIMIRELDQKEYLPEICKAAILKYYAGIQVETQWSDRLQRYLRDLCEQGMIFAFYEKYPSKWLREVQLHDKKIVEYQAQTTGTVRIVYRISNGEYQTETMLPTYENTYSKEFIIYVGESLEWYFEEEFQGNIIVSDKHRLEVQQVAEQIGIYGRINQMLELPQAQRLEAMLQYKLEEEYAKEFFQAY